MKLIDGDELMKEFDRRRYHEPDFDLTDAEWLINDAEEIEDAVEVVRCRDCEWHDKCRYEQHLGLEGFCSKGERREDEALCD